MTDGVLRYQRKPQKTTDDGLTVARYEPGEPLDDLLLVARMADQQAEIAEVSFTGGRVLLVRYVKLFADNPDVDWVVVQPNGYLAYSHQTGNLFETDEADLRHWYDLAGRP